MKTRVVNLHKERCDVYIGRPSDFGNPFSVWKYGRKGCIAMYWQYFCDRIEHDPEFKKAVEALKGKTLGCFCKPKACHGDVIVEFLEGKENEHQTTHKSN